MSEPWGEFAQVALAHLLAVASPGPDFALVLRQSLAHGRRTAVWTSVGVGAGILLHVVYSVLGIGLLIKGSDGWFAAVKYAGAAYIAWLGVQALRARPRAGQPGEGAAEAGGAVRAQERAEPTARAAWTTGFLTNALNPKVTLFFLALFVMVVSPQTPKWVQAGYGLWMAAVTVAWFALVSVLFTHEPVRRRFMRQGHWIDRALGVVFLLFALKLALATAG